MFRKSKKDGNEPRKMNAFGWSKRRGGAGAVACALGLAVLLLALSFSTAVNHAAIPPHTQIDEPELPDNGFDPDSWVAPDKTPVPVEYNAGTPSRIPV